MSGLAIAAEIAALKPGIKVLFMTGYGDTRDFHRRIAERGYALLFKPFTPERLSAKIDAVLGKNNGEPASAN